MKKTSIARRYSVEDRDLNFVQASSSESGLIAGLELQSPFSDGEELC